MSHLENVQSLAAADCERVKELIAGIEATKASAEETVSGFEAVGAEGKAAEASGLTDQLEGAQATAESTIAIFEAIHAQAEALKTGGQAAGSARATEASDYDVSFPEPRSEPSEASRLYSPGSGKDAADVSELLRGYQKPTEYEDLRSEPVEKIGDKETAPSLGPKDYQLELQDLDADQNKNRFQRGSRNLVRKSGRLEGSAKEGASIANGSIKNNYDPLQHGRSEAQVPSSSPHSTSTTPDMSVPDIVSSSLIVTIAIAEGVSRISRRRKRG